MFETLALAAANVAIFTATNPVAFVTIVATVAVASAAGALATLRIAISN